MYMTQYDELSAVHTYGYICTNIDLSGIIISLKYVHTYIHMYDHRFGEDRKSKKGEGGKGGLKGKKKKKKAFRYIF